MSDDIKTVTDVTKTVSDDTKTEAKKYDEEYVNTLKAESIKRGKDLKDVEAKLKKFEDEKLTESEKDKNKIKELEIERDKILSERKEEKIDNLILKKANGKNVIDIDALMMFAKKELATVEIVDDKVVGSVIDKILKEKPYLINSTNIIPGDGNFKKNNNESAKDPISGFNSWLQKKWKE